MSDLHNVLLDHHPLFVAEGKFEKVVLNKLKEADCFFFPSIQVLDITNRRSASSVQQSYLNMDFDWPVSIVRVLDSRSESFRLGKLYSERFPVFNVYTRPEIEMLTIINEGYFDNYYRKQKSKMKPSEYCKNVLNMKRIKSEAFQNEYWDINSLVQAIQKYKELMNLGPKEYCLADLLQV